MTNGCLKHGEYDGQGQVVVVNRALVGDLAPYRVSRGGPLKAPLWTLLEVIFDTKYRRHLLGAGDLTAVAELMLPEFECQINVWRMGLVEQHLAEIELKLRPGKDFGIGVVAEAILALRPDDVHEAPKVQRPASETHWEEPHEFGLRGGAEADRTAVDKALVGAV